MNPRVTVLVPVFNRPRYVKEALESVLPQECEGGFEVLVVDDGSTDETPDVVRAFGDPVRVIRQDNAGPAVARNRGLREARGEFVALLDSDDVWLPGKLAAQVELLSARPEAVFLHSDVEEFFEDDPERRWKNRPLVLDGQVHRELLRRNHVHTMTVVLRREAVLAVGGFDAEYPPCEDWDLWLRLTENAPVVGDPVPRVRVRIHEGGISSDPIVVYTQAARLLAAAAERLAAAGHADADFARRQAARWNVKLGRRLARAGRGDEADAAYERAIALHGLARLQVWHARLRR